MGFPSTHSPRGSPRHNWRVIVNKMSPLTKMPQAGNSSVPSTAAHGLSIASGSSTAGAGLQPRTVHIFSPISRLDLNNVGNLVAFETDPSSALKLPAAGVCSSTLESFKGKEQLQIVTHAEGLQMSAAGAGFPGALEMVDRERSPGLNLVLHASAVRVGPRSHQLQSRTAGDQISRASRWRSAADYPKPRSSPERHNWRLKMGFGSTLSPRGSQRSNWRVKEDRTRPRTIISQNAGPLLPPDKVTQLEPALEPDSTIDPTHTSTAPVRGLTTRPELNYIDGSPAIGSDPISAELAMHHGAAGDLPSPGAGIETPGSIIAGQTTTISLPDFIQGICEMVGIPNGRSMRLVSFIIGNSRVEVYKDLFSPPVSEGTIPEVRHVLDGGAVVEIMFG